MNYKQGTSKDPRYLLKRANLAKDILAGRRQDLNKHKLVFWHHAWIQCTPKISDAGDLQDGSNYEERPAEFVFKAS